MTSIQSGTTVMRWSNKEQLVHVLFCFFNGDCQAAIKLKDANHLLQLWELLVFLAKNPQTVEYHNFSKMCVLSPEFYTNCCIRKLKSSDKCQLHIWNWGSVSTGLSSTGRGISGCLAFDCDYIVSWFWGEYSWLNCYLSSLSADWKWSFCWLKSLQRTA